MKEFFTRQQANEGVVLPLSLPDGSPSEHWIRVLGIDSDAFRKADQKAKRAAVEIAQIEGDQERAEMVREVEIECISSLISEWSFDQPCDTQNKVDFLKEAPQIADMVNRFAARRSEFFTKKPASSTRGSKPKSNSRKSRKGPKQH